MLRIETKTKRFSKIYMRPVSFNFQMQTKKVYFNPYIYTMGQVPGTPAARS